MQSLSILTLSLHLPRIQPNLQKRNHFAKMCPSNKHVKEIMQNDSDSPASEDEQTYVSCITAKRQSPTHKQKMYGVNSSSKDWFVTLEVNGTKTRFKIDSASQVNIISRKDYHLLKNKPGLKPTHPRLTAYNSTSITVRGTCAVQISHKTNTYNVPIIVADTDASPILELKTNVGMHLIKSSQHLKG